MHGGRYPLGVETEACEDLISPAVLYEPVGDAKADKGYPVQALSVHGLGEGRAEAAACDAVFDCDEDPGFRRVLQDKLGVYRFGEPSVDHCTAYAMTRENPACLESSLHHGPKGRDGGVLALTEKLGAADPHRRGLARRGDAFDGCLGIPDGARPVVGEGAVEHGLKLEIVGGAITVMPGASRRKDMSKAPWCVRPSHQRCRRGRRQV